MTSILQKFKSAKDLASLICERVEGTTKYNCRYAPSPQIEMLKNPKIIQYETYEKDDIDKFLQNDLNATILDNSKYGYDHKKYVSDYSNIQILNFGDEESEEIHFTKFPRALWR